jgi:FolB domain-containing protein
LLTAAKTYPNISMKENWIECTIKDLRLRTIIGFNDIETKEKQDVVITICYKYNAQKAIVADDVKLGFNYKTLTKKIIGFVESSRFKLLEALAQGIIDIVTENKELKDISVIVEKPGALRFTDNVIVKITS